MRRKTSWSRSAAGGTGSIRRQRRFPIMSGREFDELVEEVRVNGLREPVVVSGDQQVGGRNRVRACAAAGVAPEVRELEYGTDVASWVMSMNLHRRHLDASQRALLASRLSALSGEVTLIQAGELMGVSRASVARAAAVEKGPEPLRADARDGVVPVGDAYELRGEEPETIEQLAEGSVLWVTGGGRSGRGGRAGRGLRQEGLAVGQGGRGRPCGCRVSLGPTADGSPGADRGVVRSSVGGWASSNAVGLPGGDGRLQKGVRRLRGRSGDDASVGACRTRGRRRERSGRDPYRGDR